MGISAIIDGLTILKEINPDVPIVTQAYVIRVPGILSGLLTGPQQSAMIAAGWLIETAGPYTSTYYYSVKTLPDLAAVSGADKKNKPIISVPVLQPIKS
jgi:hypothetical protein